MFDIKEKVVLITGGAKGIGFNIAKDLLRHGVKGVSLVDIDVVNGEKAAQELLEEFGTECALFINTDITNEVEFEEAFRLTIKKFKHLDIVINNAGIMHELQWRKCVAVNFEGVIIGSKLAMEKYLPTYKSGEEGVIVNIASGLGIEVIEEIPVYVATKHGIVGYSRSIAGPVHYEKYKVRVIAVCPGLTDTGIFHLTEEQQIEPFRGNMSKLVKRGPIQKTHDLSKSIVQLIIDASPGSVWLLEDGEQQQVY